MQGNVESKIFMLIIVICVILLIVSIIKQRFEWIVNVGLRAVAGLLAIYILNNKLQNFSIDVAVGMNAFSALTIGTLGLPGFVLLYGLAFYFFLV